MSRISKRYKELTEKIDKSKVYELGEAIKLLKENSKVKFDESIDLSVNLNLLAKHTIRDTVTLPNVFGNPPKILVFAKGDKANEAKEAGADYVGDDDLIQKISDGWLDFDITIATPDMMKSIGKIARILGTRGLMPNPKTNTVTNDIKQTVTEFKKGKKEFRADKTGIVNFPIGKVSLEDDKIIENYKVFMEMINKKKPVDLKGEYIKNVVLTTTMGIGLKINFKVA